MNVAHQAPLFMGFPRQEYWSRLPFPSLRYLPGLGIEPVSPVLSGDSLPLSHQGSLEMKFRCGLLAKTFHLILLWVCV